MDVPNAGKVLRNFDFNNVRHWEKAEFVSERNDLQLYAKKTFLNQAWQANL